MNELDQVVEYLAELLDRDPTQLEVEEFIAEQEARAYDLAEEEMKGN